MASGTDGDSTSLSPDDAFALLGNRTRFEILQVLWETYDPFGAENAVSFSSLHERVGYGDTGNFNYHLGKLVDHFVRRTDAGYELTESGFQIVRAVVAGTVNRRPEIEPTVIDVACPRCDAPIEIDYVNQRTLARCTQCTGLVERARAPGTEEALLYLPFQPAGWIDRTPEEAFHATVTVNFQLIRSFLAGVCPYCGGVVDEVIDVCDEHALCDLGLCGACDRQYAVELRETCRRCKASERGPLTITILTHSAVTAFYHDHGIDHRFETWDAFRRGLTVEEEVLATDPLRVRLTVSCQGDRLRLTLDESLDVVDAVRETSYTST